MSIDNLDFLKEISLRRMREAPTEYNRYLYNQIDWRDRLILIKGARGVGKTTMILQHMQSAHPDPDLALYVSLDHLWFADHSLYDTAEYHYLHGGTHLFIDEVHYLKNWQQLIKNIYDDFPKLHIVYSGSSLLKLETSEADLSRRQIEYSLAGLSFREFLLFEGVRNLDSVSLENLLRNHVGIAGDITKGQKILSLFSAYLRRGYYPFYREVYSGYNERIEQIIEQVLSGDYPATEEISFGTIQKIKKMLMILAKSAPQTPNMSALYKELETDRNQGLKMLYTLERAELINLLSSEKKSLKNMSRPDKIYCNNTNEMAAIVERPESGCMRETFFLNQLRGAGHSLLYPAAGDFLVDNQYLFEVGGKGKSFAQIRDIPNSFLAVDDTEIGHGNRIPLWMFGLLY